MGSPDQATQEVETEDAGIIQSTTDLVHGMYRMIAKMFRTISVQLLFNTRMTGWADFFHSASAVLVMVVVMVVRVKIVIYGIRQISP